MVILSYYFILFELRFLFCSSLLNYCYISSYVVSISFYCMCNMAVLPENRQLLNYYLSSCTKKCFSPSGRRIGGTPDFERAAGSFIHRAAARRLQGKWEEVSLEAQQQPGTNESSCRR